MSIEQEKAGLAKIIDHMKAAGWVPYKLCDGEEFEPIQPGSATAEVVEACCATDEATLYFNTEPGRMGHSVFLVWGNSPSELIADNSMGHGFDVALDEALRAVFPGYPNCED